jgi:hypothetical protein
MIIGIIRQFLFAIQNAWADNPDRPVTPIPPWSYDAGEVDDLLRPESTRPVNVHVQRGLVAIGALGPGILGLMADNDAGGMTSYLVTGARHQLLLFIPALLVMAVVTLFIQDMAL